MPFEVLLVCTGNTCRSAMAEGILRSLLPGDRGADVRVGSAGTVGLAGAPAAEHATDVCAEHGIDIRSHESRALTPQILGRADLVLAMARGHLGSITSLSPEAADRAFLLSEFAGSDAADVPDPIGGPKELYERAYSMLEDYLERSLPTILRLASREER